MKYYSDSTFFFFFILKVFLGVLSLDYFSFYFWVILELEAMCGKTIHEREKYLNFWISIYTFTRTFSPMRVQFWTVISPYFDNVLFTPMGSSSVLPCVRPLS